ncbi:hypothetical protein Taro_029201 [Colocasia esculenta]|uniref:Uncharacterized protein n=1 Tax=Colocasia esculenta TaxID=4460 RepID=A0A843VD73_COLES|nr:hypothetical protein [Colocasia esculenta]
MKAWSALRRQGVAPRFPCRDGRRTLRTALLVLVSCNLVLALTKAHRHLPVHPRPDKPSTAAFHNGARPVGFLLSRASTIAMAYASAAACGGGHGRAPEEMLSRAGRTWKRPAATLLCVELLATACSSLLWTLSALTRATRGPAAEALFMSASAALALWLGPVLFAHSEIACRLSLVASIEEEDCEGMEALRRAGEVVEGRKVQGFVVAMLLAQLEQAPAPAGAAAGGFVGAALHLIVKFLSCLVYTMFYQYCKKKHGKGGEKGKKD